MNTDCAHLVMVALLCDSDAHLHIGHVVCIA